MGNSINGFRDGEFVILSHYDKREEKWVETVYPKVGGRLRLAHEDNDQISINAEVIKYDQNVAVIKAVVETRKGIFSGFGMASLERDERIAPAILELAETRGIARALRFAGYGIEYCGAEEVSHLSNGKAQKPEPDTRPPAGSHQENDHRRENANSGNGGNGNGNGGESSRITNKQLNYIINLGKDQGLGSKDLDKEAVSQFGVRMNHLTVKDASTFIEGLKVRENVPF